MSIQVNIACSAGIESMSMLQMAMSKGFNVTLVWLGVSGNRFSNLAEMRGIIKAVNYFKNMDEAHKAKYPGHIVDILFSPKAHYQPMAGDVAQVVNTGTSQQYCTVLGMADAMSATINNRNYPTTWIGWLAEDTSEHSQFEMDYSASEYKELLDLNKQIGRLSGSNTIAKAFRAPLWDFSKKDLWDGLDNYLKTCVVPNGEGFDHGNGEWVHTPFKNKAAEYKKAGIPIQEKYTSFADYTNDEDLLVRVLCGMASWKDLDLPPEAQYAVLETSPFSSAARFIQHSSIPRMRKTLRSRVLDKIWHAQKVVLDPKDVPAKEEKTYEA